MMHKKIAIIVNVPSSILIFRKELILRLVEMGAQVYCFAYGYTEEEKSVVRSWGAIPEDSLLDTRGMNPLLDISATYSLYKKLKNIAPDVVLACFVKTVIFSAFAAKLARVPLKVGMIEGLGNAFTEYKSEHSKKASFVKRVQVLLYRWSLPLLDSVIVLNKDDKKDLIEKYRIPVKRTCVLGGIGVDLDYFKYSSPPNCSNGVVFLFIGRLVTAKGIFDFIDAAKIVKRRYPSAVFRVIGEIDEGNPFSINKAMLAQCVSDGLIEYKGYVTDISSEIQNSSVFVLPSYREGVPRSIQEAMAVGRPIITTDVPGCRETVIDGENGWLVEKWNVDALARAMIYFLDNPSEIEKKGIKSRELAEGRFDVHMVNEKLIQLLGLMEVV